MLFLQKRDGYQIAINPSAVTAYEAMQFCHIHFTRVWVGNGIFDIDMPFDSFMAKVAEYLK